MNEEPSTVRYQDLDQARCDAVKREVSVWRWTGGKSMLKSFTSSAGIRYEGVSPYVTGSYDGLIRDLGYNFAGNYTWEAAPRR